MFIYDIWGRYLDANPFEEEQPKAQTASDNATDAAIHWRLLKDLDSASRQFGAEMHQSPAFCSLTFTAHRDAALFRLIRLYPRPAT